MGLVFDVDLKCIVIGEGNEGFVCGIGEGYVV